MTGKSTKQSIRKPRTGRTDANRREQAAIDSRTEPDDDDEFERGMFCDKDLVQPDPMQHSFASDEPEYEVGYRRPPREHRFQPGQSGNPSGRQRPPCPAGLGQAIFESANRIERVSRGGRTVKMTRFEIMAERLITQALTGNLKDLITVLNTLQRLGIYVVEEELQRLQLAEQERQSETGWTAEMEERFQEIEAEFFEDPVPRPKGNGKKSA